MEAGFQGALAAPLGGDLRITSGAGPGWAAGVHGGYAFNERHTLKLRVERWALPQGHQTFAGAPVAQDLATKVGAVAWGAEYLWRPGGSASPWAAGAGVYCIRWSVASEDTLTTQGGSTRSSGTSAWTRQGLGLLGSYRITPHLEAEARAVFSHYGYENLNANVALVGLAWRF